MKSTWSSPFDTYSLFLLYTRLSLTSKGAMRYLYILWNSLSCAYSFTTFLSRDGSRIVTEIALVWNFFLRIDFNWLLFYSSIDNRSFSLRESPSATVLDFLLMGITSKLNSTSRSSYLASLGDKWSWVFRYCNGLWSVCTMSFLPCTYDLLSRNVSPIASSSNSCRE